MITGPTAPTAVYGRDVGLRYGLIGVHGYGIAVTTVARMLDAHGSGTVARVLRSDEAVPWGAQPLLVAETTVYGAVCVERMVREWNPQVPRPWLVLVADVPARPVPAARYRFRALRSRLAGVAELPYLPSLRTVEGPEEAMKHTDVMKAAANLRRQVEGEK